MGGSDRIGSDRIYDVRSVWRLRCTDMVYSRQCSASTSYNTQYCLLTLVHIYFVWYLLPLIAQVKDPLSGWIQFKVRMITVIQWTLCS